MPDPEKPSTDDLLRDATCAVLIDSEVRGTAWLLSDDGYLMTAGHIIADDLKKPTGTIDMERVTVQFLKLQAAGDQAASGGESDLSSGVELVEWDYNPENQTDFAILKLLKPIKRRPLLFSLTREVEVGSKIRLRGYGKDLPGMQWAGIGEFVGKSIVASDSSDDSLFQLQSYQIDTPGFSGGAVFSDGLGLVVAIQVAMPEDKPWNVLAMPLYRIADRWEELKKLETRGTCRVIGPRDDSARLERLVDEIVRPPVSEMMGYRIEVSDYGVTKTDIAELENADLVVADVTGKDPNVIYELSIGHSLGRPDIVIGEVGHEADYAKMPFEVITMDLDQPEVAQKKLRDRLKVIKEVRQDLSKLTARNPITDFFRAPLTEVSPAYGLALGHYNNFVRRVAVALCEARRGVDWSITLSKAGADGKMTDQHITDEQRKKIRLNIVIPKKLDWARHDFIDSYIVTKERAVKAAVETEARPFTLWALPKPTKEGYLELLDVFPTTMNVMQKAIDHRLAIEDGDRDSPDWEMLERREIDRFEGSLRREIERDRYLSKGCRVKTVVRVVTWSEFFPGLEEEIDE